MVIQVALYVNLERKKGRAEHIVPDENSGVTSYHYFELY